MMSASHLSEIIRTIEMDMQTLYSIIWERLPEPRKKQIRGGIVKFARERHLIVLLGILEIICRIFILNSDHQVRCRWY